jgi:hypothetical protein
MEIEGYWSLFLNLLVYVGMKDLHYFQWRWKYYF